MLDRMRDAWRRPEVRWLVVLALIGLVERAALALIYQPVPYGDTPSYMRLATQLVEGGLNAYDGTRVPGYPAFLALLGREASRVWVAQLTLGWLTSLLLFWIGWKSTGSAALGLAIGLLYDLIPGQVFFEFNLLTESLATFLIVLSFALLLALERSRGRGVGLMLAIVLGFASGLAGLVRALFYFLPPWLLFFILFSRGRGWKDRLTRSLAFSLPAVLLLGGWLGFIYTQYHMLSPSTMGGYHLVQHTGAFFEYLPDDVGPIRDTYLKYRDARVAERGVQTNTIWDAIPELTEVTGLSFYDLSREMQRLSLRLIREHPDLYLRSVAQGWIAFWKAPVYWKPDLLLPWAVRPVRLWVLAGRGISLLANAAFLGLSALVLVSRRARRRLAIDRYAAAIGGLVWLSSVIQTLVDHGDNPRFLVPLQIMVIYLVLRSARFALRREESAL